MLRWLLRKDLVIGLLLFIPLLCVRVCVCDHSGEAGIMGCDLFEKVLACLQPF